MIKLKTVLAENMRRFGTKNLNEGMFSNFLQSILGKTDAMVDFLTILEFARKDKDGENADEAVQYLMDKHNVSADEALKTVTHVYEKFGPWIELTRK
jgi:L-fucose isomerase-like protein